MGTSAVAWCFCCLGFGLGFQMLHSLLTVESLGGLTMKRGLQGQASLGLLLGRLAVEMLRWSEKHGGWSAPYVLSESWVLLRLVGRRKSESREAE